MADHIPENCDFLTIATPGEATVREKMSRFIAFALHASDASDARATVARYANEYHDARHVCWAWMIGADRKEYLSSDNGEPSGTAGKPILGQINSAGLTDVVVIVVRYFGGIKLGTSGLIAAYREAARQAIAAAEIVSDCVRVELTVTFPYESMNHIMKVVKQSTARIVSQQFDNICSLTLSVRSDEAAALLSRLTP
ncbi:MAG: YigZ family protein [Clostridium sp.]|nr:YigZ family protein [Clostridium sp.]